MKNSFIHLISLILYGGIEKENYQSIESDINRKNKETLLLGSGICAVMFLALLIGSLVSSTMSAAKILYAVILLICCGIYILLHTSLGNKRWTVRILWYLLFLAFGNYAVMLNTVIRPNLSAVTLCVFMVAGPLLVIERPYRIEIIQVLLAVEYLIGAFLAQKPYLVAFADSVNILCCFFLGATIYIRMTQVRLREALQARMLQKERDTDKLTGFLNKAALENQIRDHLSVSHQQGALIIMDIDNFKNINDNYGHAYGDLVLNQTAKCIREIVPENCLCGRFGGDEFLLLLPDITRSELIDLLDMMSREMVSTIQLPNPADIFSCSIGVALYPLLGKDYPTLFKIADTALYEVKNTAKNGWKIAQDIQRRL